MPGVPDEVDDINTFVLSKKDKSLGAQSAVGIVTTSMTIPGSSKPSFYQRLQVKKAAPTAMIEATKASVAIPFPPIRPEKIRVQWYGSEFVDREGIEEEVIEKPVPKGWGIWVQSDVIGKEVYERQKNCRSAGEGVVIGEAESLRILDLMDQAQELAGIK